MKWAVVSRKAFVGDGVSMKPALEG